MIINDKTCYSILIKKVWKDDFSWKKEKLKLALIMFVMDRTFLGFLLEKPSQKKKKTSKLEWLNATLLTVQLYIVMIQF